MRHFLILASLLLILGGCESPEEAKNTSNSLSEKMFQVDKATRVNPAKLNGLWEGTFRTQRNMEIDARLGFQPNSTVIAFRCRNRAGLTAYSAVVVKSRIHRDEIEFFENKESVVQKNGMSCPVSVTAGRYAYDLSWGRLSVDGFNGDLEKISDNFRY